MKIDQYIVVLDACVLAPMPIADTLLRLAEEPAFYTLRYTQTQVDRRINAMRTAFPDAAVTGYEDLTEAMKNDSKDRHVLAAEVRCGAHAIVSDNKKHFPAKALTPYGLECMSADEFIKHQYHLDPDSFINVLDFEARAFARESYRHEEMSSQDAGVTSTGAECAVVARGRFHFMPPLNSRPTTNLVPFFRQLRTEADPASAILSARSRTKDRSGSASGTWIRMPDSHTSMVRAVANLS